jgi:hypothetical protein
MLPLRLPAAAGALASVGLTSLALAGPASAAPEYYGVTVDGTVEVTATAHADEPKLQHDSSLSTSTRVTSGFLAIIQRAGGHIISASGGDQHDATTTSTASSTERRWDHIGDQDWYQYGRSCSGTVWNKNDVGRTTLAPDPLAPLTGAGLVLNLADVLEVELSGCQQTGRDGVGSGLGNFRIESPVSEDDDFGPTGPLAVPFHLPTEATTAGKTIQLYEGPVAGHADYCPQALKEFSYLKTCRVTFKGTITFERTDLGITPDAPPAAPAPAPAPAPKPAPKPVPADDDDLLAPLIPQAQKARVDAKGAEVSFRAACPQGCTGTATILVPASSKAATRAATPIAKKRARTRRLATVTFTVAKSPKARTVRVTVPKKVRAKLRRAKGATVVLALKDRGTKRTSKATLKLAR